MAATDADGARVPLYAIANEVYTDDDSTTYVSVLSSLDVTEIDYDAAIEYAGGRATIAAYDGALFVASPEAPAITRFAVDRDGTLEEEGTVSFLDYGFESVSIDEWGNAFISTTKAYLFHPDGSAVIWNPTTMEIRGEVDQGDFDLVRDFGDLNGSAAVARGNRLFKTVFWSDWDAWKTSSEQYLAVYDTDSDVLIELIEETRCPGLGNRVASDEDGNLYFSNWIWNVAETLVAGAPESCALRIESGEERFDQDFRLAYPEATGGRQGAMFTYLGDGEALVSVFHDERATIDAGTAPAELASTDNWRLWMLDMEAGDAAPLEGIEWMTGAATTVGLDGRSFVMVPGADWSVTSVYELERGQATHRFDVNGWSYQFQKLR